MQSIYYGGHGCVMDSTVWALKPQKGHMIYKETYTGPNPQHPEDCVTLSMLFNFYDPQFSHWEGWVDKGIKIQNTPKFSGISWHTVGAQGVFIRVSNCVCARHEVKLFADF